MYKNEFGRGSLPTKINLPMPQMRSKPISWGPIASLHQTNGVPTGEESALVQAKGNSRKECTMSNNFTSFMYGVKNYDHDPSGRCR